MSVWHWPKDSASQERIKKKAESYFLAIYQTAQENAKNSLNSERLIIFPVESKKIDLPKEEPKMNWPLNTEIETKGGGKAYLYEEKNGRLFGRAMPDVLGSAHKCIISWHGQSWELNGQCRGSVDYDLIPTKRKIYLAWTEGEPKPAVYLDKDSAEEYSTFYKGLKIRTIQEVTEP